MDSNHLLLLLDAALVSGFAGAALLIAWRRRLPADFVGRVKADAGLAMLRALLVLLVGLALAIGVRLAGPPAFSGIGDWVAFALIAVGGLAFVARVTLYRLRIKPELDHLAAPVAARPAQRPPAPSAHGTDGEDG